MMKPKNIIGNKYKKLTVIELDHIERNQKRKENIYFYKCLCECGNYKIIRKCNLGRTKSCGCAKTKPPLNYKHGAAIKGKREKLYNVWLSMRDRCNNQKSKFYYRYGDRNIKVCNEWNDYSVFKEFCIKNGYKTGLEIDRIDNDGNYEPNNCRFITHSKNLQNTHRKQEYEINGEKMLLKEIANKYRIKQATIYTRYRRGKRGDDLIAKPRNKIHN